MPQLTVILMRNAQSEDEELTGPPPPTLDTSDASVDADFVQYIRDQAGDERGRDQGQHTLSVRVDPELTALGFEQAQTQMTHLIAALAASSSKARNIALFCAPLRTCASTAMMISCAHVPKYDEKLLWTLSSYDAAVAPSAIPIGVENGLANGDAQIARIAGYKCAVDAGLLHCAAHPFNDGRTKCPIMKVIKRMKEKTQERIDAWDDARDESGSKLHQVTAVQYFRIEKNSNPWILKEMVPKCNLLIDITEPKHYMLTPRQGYSDPKKHYKEWEQTAEPYIKKAILSARKVGCDTVIMVVPGAAIKSVAGDAVASYPTPCCVASLRATVANNAPEDVQLRVHKVVEAIGADVSTVIPPFAGSVDRLIEPPMGKDPTKVNLPGSSKWAQFPAPEPEVIPASYPSLPDFALALDMPMPELSSSKAPSSQPQRKPKVK
jgi:hypothetical protein